VNPVNEHGDMIAISTYRKMEADLYDQIYDLEFENAGLRVELEQQAICNGKGSEREAALLAEVDDLQRQLDNARTGWLCDTCDGRACEGQRQSELMFAENETLRRHNANLVNVLEALAKGKDVPGVTVAEIAEYAQRAVNIVRKEQP